MLSDLHEDAWGSAIRLTCGGPAPAPKGGGLEQWVQLHFDTSDEAAKAFGYNREGVERLDLIDTATRETAQKQVYAVLRPTWFAYQRAKHKHALHLLSIARAGGHERAFCGTKAR